MWPRISIGFSGRPKLVTKKLGHSRHLTAIVDGRNLDRLLEDVASFLLPFRFELGRNRQRVGGGKSGRRERNEDTSEQALHRFSPRKQETEASGE
jgi:hypothetical protein